MKRKPVSTKNFRVRRDAADKYLQNWYAWSQIEDKESLEAKRLETITGHMLGQWLEFYEKGKKLTNDY